MDKRFALFMALSVLIFMANLVVISWLHGPVDPGRGVARQGPERPLNDGDDLAEAKERVDEGDGTSTPIDRKGVDVPPEEAAQLAHRPEPRDDIPQEWLALGSLDPEDGYRLLMVVTNRGAAIERVELSGSRYHDLQDRGGYLGPLALTEEPEGGCRIGVVGRGTPAAQAGLQPGDLITRIDEEVVQKIEDLDGALSARRPGQEVTVALERNGEPQPSVQMQLRRRPLAVMRPERENLLMRGKEIPAEFRDRPSLLMTLERVGEQKLGEELPQLPGVDMYDSNWEVIERNDSSVAFRRVISELQLEIIKRYQIDQVPELQRSDATYPGYGIEFQVEIRSLRQQPTDVAYRIDGPTGLPLEGWWYANKIGRGWGSVGMRDMVVRFENKKPELFGAASIADEDVEAMGQGSSLMFAGVDAQYFASVLIPRKQQLDNVWFEETRAVRLGEEEDEKVDKRLTNITCRMISKPQKLEAGETLRHQFTLFAGPKKPQLLEKYGQETNMTYSLKDLVYYGWFGWVAKPMLAILHFFYFIFRNYGIAIVLLTVLVRGSMFPLSLKQTKNMKQMQELQPEMKRIADKYKTDMEKRTKAQQELFRKHNYNPMGGCMVMFIQLPIFIGLYRSLMVDVELRQAPLLGESIRWCSNLAAPDMFLDWSRFMPAWFNNGEGMFALGPYLNLLPLVTVAMFIWQQKMFMPPPADEQAAIQQKIMKYMMIFIGVLFYKVASGLCLYFIASSLWGIAERKLLPKTSPPGQSSQPAATPVSVSNTSNGNLGAGRKKKKKQRKR